MRFLPNGQWTLAKSTEDSGPAPTTLHGLVGKTHTVEVHPHMDHLYRLKNHIQAQGKQSMPIRDIKKSEFGHLADKLPRDAKGNVTPEMIDKHIAGLPKHKVDIKVVPYKMGAQQHREGVPQYVASVGFHPNSLDEMSPKEFATWDSMRAKQHDLGGHEHQVGWARIDPYKTETGTKVMQQNPSGIPPYVARTLKSVTPNEGHWHIDEIQSDFGDPKKIDHHIKAHTDPANIFSDITRQLTGHATYPSAERPDGRTFNEVFAEQYPELAPHIDNFKRSYKEREAANQEAFATRRGDKTRSDGIDSSTGIHRYDTPEESAALQAKYAANQEAHEARVKPFMDAATEHSLKLGKERADKMVPAKKMNELMSHGHDDPMHMVHSAVNQLGRQNGIESMSMDTPNHQAHQSGLRPANAEPSYPDDADEQILDHIQRGGVTDEAAQNLWQDYGHHAIDANAHDIHFKSAAEKLGPEGLKQFAHLVPKDSSSWIFNGGGDPEWNEVLGDEAVYKDHFDPEVRKKLLGMTDNEKDALSRFANDYRSDVHSNLQDALGLDNHDDGDMHPDDAEYDLPVHQINTYDKRPKKLGFQTVDKKGVLGEHPHDQYNKVQYTKLAKKLRLLQELLRKA